MYKLTEKHNELFDIMRYNETVKIEEKANQLIAYQLSSQSYVL